MFDFNQFNRDYYKFRNSDEHRYTSFQDHKVGHPYVNWTLLVVSLLLFIAVTTVGLGVLEWII